MSLLEAKERKKESFVRAHVIGESKSTDIQLLHEHAYERGVCQVVFRLSSQMRGSQTDERVS